MKPARAAISRSPHTFSGAVHASWFQSEPIHHETILEKQVISFLLLTPAVTRIEHQPLRHCYEGTDSEEVYFPDFRVTLSDGSSVLVEAKGQPFEKSFRKKLSTGLQQSLRAGGVPLYLVLSQNVDERRAEAADQLRGDARRVLSPERVQDLRSWVASQADPTVGRAQEDGFSKAEISHAVGRRILTVGPSFDLTSHATLLETSDYENLQLDHWLGYPGWAEDVSL